MLFIVADDIHVVLAAPVPAALLLFVSHYHVEVIHVVLLLAVGGLLPDGLVVAVREMREVLGDRGERQMKADRKMTDGMQNQ